MRRQTSAARKRAGLVDHCVLYLAPVLFGGDDVLEKHATRLREIMLTYTSLSFDRFEDKVRRIDLAVRMWI